MAITGIKFIGRKWAVNALERFGFSKPGEVKAVPAEVSEANARKWAETWPNAFELIEGKPEPTERSVDEPPKHRMRKSPTRKRGKANES